MLIVLIGCKTQKNVSSNKELQLIEVKDGETQSNINFIMKASIDETEENLVNITAYIYSMIDSLQINQIKIESPSFVKPSLGSEFVPSLLMKTERIDHSFSFIILETISFKLKGIVYGDINQGKTKVSAIQNIFFFWDEDHYIISDDVKQIIGKEKKNGDIITIEDLKIFNRVEIEQKYY